MIFPSVSIIIAVKQNNPLLEECVDHCIKLDYPFFEVIILPDDMMGVYNERHIKIIATGKALPAAKRDIGASNASGEILAFLDDDTYPTADWLKNAVINFNEESIACVGGPAVTPENEPFLNKASGKVYESLIISGPARFRYVPLRKRFTDDFPSCNFFIRNNIFQEIGGFKTKFWPGEDTILCLEVVHKLKKRILYDPAVIVYHHRRQLFKKHLSQIVSYATHRGYFLKRYPQTSLKFGYFIPSIMTAIILGSLILGLVSDLRFFYVPLFYLLFVFVFSIQKSLKLSFYVFAGSILTHLTYGLNFIKGFLSFRLREEL
ncbi:MAG: glycosyltransferase [Candidatus Omnitrophica bacterium]|nr:glycosyltransferase [Candidatus Omnitrophota bacterium]MDD5352464.1 glycosyltransferase [Candidatus Omnitrophota bacterium]MDD5550062.1 glycosyltransferase [Candidatus Omnitrophota bacterium]